MIGLGIELGEGVLRSVLLDLDNAGGVIAAESPITDDPSIVDALVRATSAIEPSHHGVVPVRIAVAGPDLLIQSIDVTGLDRHEMIALADEAAGVGAADSMLLVDDGRRRRLCLVNGHAHTDARVAALAQRAGLRDVRVEPAPLALARVAGTDRLLVRRNIDADRSWEAVLDEGFPVVAAAASPGLAGWPSCSAFAASSTPDERATVLDADGVADHLHAAVERARVRRRGRAGLDADGWPVEAPEVSIGGRAHPAFPGHDLRATERLAVALGAAAGAAGLAERHLTVERLAPMRRPVAPTRRAWALEPVVDTVEADDRRDRGNGERTGDGDRQRGAVPRSGGRHRRSTSRHRSR